MLPPLGSLASTTWVIYTWVWGWFGAVMLRGSFHRRPAFGKGPPNQAFSNGLSAIHLLLTKTKLKTSMGGIRVPASGRLSFTFSSETDWGLGRGGWHCSFSSQSAFSVLQVAGASFPRPPVCRWLYTEARCTDNFKSSIRALCDHPHVMQHSEGWQHRTKPLFPLGILTAPKTSRRGNFRKVQIQ